MSHIIDLSFALIDEIEGPQSRRWACDGIRLKDTRAWCEFYVSLRTIGASHPGLPSGERPYWYDRDALEIAKRFLPYAHPQRVAQLQLAITHAMMRAGSESGPLPEQLVAALAEDHS